MNLFVFVRYPSSFKYNLAHIRTFVNHIFTFCTFLCFFVCLFVHYCQFCFIMRFQLLFVKKKDPAYGTPNPFSFYVRQLLFKDHSKLILNCFLPNQNKITWKIILINIVCSIAEYGIKRHQRY